MVDPQSFDRFATDYDRYTSLEPSTVLDWLLTQLPRHGRRALDAGCGSGRHALALADRFDDVVGVDLSRPLIDLARRRRPHPRIRYQAGDLLATTDPPGFDLVFSATTLHHLADLDAALRHLRGLVAPGGTAILVDNVAPRPTPPGWVYRLGAVREHPADLRRLGWARAWWLLRFRTGRPGWTTWPATATSPAGSSNGAMVPSSPAPASSRSATPTPSSGMTRPRPRAVRQPAPSVHPGNPDTSLPRLVVRVAGQLGGRRLEPVDLCTEGGTEWPRSSCCSPS
jgi:SAM-dependent methyltransferase